jgi:hypothetical protein
VEDDEPSQYLNALKVFILSRARMERWWGSGGKVRIGHATYFNQTKKCDGAACRSLNANPDVIAQNW